MNMRDRLYHIGISGGKDSVASLIWMVNESGIPHEQLRATFCDTGNEAPETYAHVKFVSEKVFPVERIAPPLDFYQLARKKNRFPSTKARFCTQDLKLKPTKEYIDNLLREGYEVIAVSGVRREESFDRRNVPEYGDPMESYFGIVEWRPLVFWTIVEVYLLHKKYGVPMNPLYAMGAKRVGCFPCIMSRKSEVRNIAKNFPERIDFIREQEWFDGKGNPHSFFPRKKVPEEFRSTPTTTKTGEIVNVAMIDDVVAWSKTKDKKHSHGQVALEFWHEDEGDIVEACISSMGFCE